MQRRVHVERTFMQSSKQSLLKILDWIIIFFKEFKWSVEKCALLQQHLDFSQNPWLFLCPNFVLEIIKMFVYNTAQYESFGWGKKGHSDIKSDLTEKNLFGNG